MNFVSYTITDSFTKSLKKIHKIFSWKVFHRYFSKIPLLVMPSKNLPGIPSEFLPRFFLQNLSHFLRYHSNVQFRFSRNSLGKPSKDSSTKSSENFLKNALLSRNSTWILLKNAWIASEIPQWSFIYPRNPLESGKRSIHSLPQKFLHRYLC